MRQHAERGGRGAAVGVDVVDVVGDAGGVERRLVVVLVERPGIGGGADVGDHARVVLCRHEQHGIARRALHRVGERIGRRVAVPEPHLHAVAGLGAGDLPAELVVVGAGLAVALATGVLAQVAAVHATAVDLPEHPDVAERPLRVDLDGLRVAVRDRERAGHEVRRRVAEVRLGLVGPGCGLDEVQREVQVLLELGLHCRLVVLEHEAAGRERVRAVDGAADAVSGTAVELDREGLGAPVVVGVARDVAVGGVQLGRDVGVEPRDGGMVVVAGQRLHQRCVGGLGLDLPALRVEDELREGVVVDEEPRAQPPLQAARGLDLGLRGRPRAVVGLRRRDVRGALEVVVPLLGPVAVEVHPVVLGSITPSPLTSRRFLRQRRVLADVKV